jgi:hypothetical protein
MLAQFMNPLPQRAVSHAELFGDLFLGTAIHKDGAQCLITKMAGVGGLAKKVLATAVIHDPNSLEMLLICRTNQGKWYAQMGQLSMKTIAKPPKKAAPPSRTPKK